MILWTLPKSKPMPVEPATVPPMLKAAETAPGRRFDDLRAAGIKLGAVGGVTLVSSVTWFVFGGVGILIVVIATDVFNGGDAATGYLNGAIGVGGTIGALLAGALVLRPRLGRPLLLGALAFGAATLVLGLANSLLAAFIAITVLSIGNLLTDVTGMTIFQRAVPDAYRGRFGGVMMTGQVTAETLGTLTVPILVTLFGFGITFAVLGALAVGATVLAVAMIGGAADLGPSPYDTDLKRIARLPLFGGLSPARIESALRRLDPVEAVAGDVIVRQGDVADRFYVICGGTFTVTQVDGSGTGTRAAKAWPGRRVRRARPACPLPALRHRHRGDRRPRVLDVGRRLPRAHRRPGRRPRPPPRALRHPCRDVQPGVAVHGGQRRTRKRRCSTRLPSITTSGSSSRCCAWTDPK